MEVIIRLPTVPRHPRDRSLWIGGGSATLPCRRHAARAPALHRERRRARKEAERACGPTSAATFFFSGDRERDDRDAAHFRNVDHTVFHDLRRTFRTIRREGDVLSVANGAQDFAKRNLAAARRRSARGFRAVVSKNSGHNLAVFR